MSDRDPGHRSRRSARFEIRPTLGRTALFNLVLSGGLLPPPRRCARNEKKDKRSLVEKEIDTGACLIEEHCGPAGPHLQFSDCPDCLTRIPANYILGSFKMYRGRPAIADARGPSCWELKRFAR